MVAKKIYKSPIIIHPDIPSISFSFSFINSMAFSSAAALASAAAAFASLPVSFSSLGRGGASLVFTFLIKRGRSQGKLTVCYGTLMNMLHLSMLYLLNLLNLLCIYIYLSIFTYFSIVMLGFGIIFVFRFRLFLICYDLLFCPFSRNLQHFGTGSCCFSGIATF